MTQHRIVQSFPDGSKTVEVSTTHYVFLRPDGSPAAHAKFYFASQKWVVYPQFHPSKNRAYKSLRAAIARMHTLGQAQ